MFKVKKVHKEEVELHFKTKGMEGVHFLHRDVVKEGEGEGEVRWFDSVIWNPDKKEERYMEGIGGKVLFKFHVLYSRLLLGAAVARLGY